MRTMTPEIKAKYAKLEVLKRYLPWAYKEDVRDELEKLDYPRNYRSGQAITDTKVGRSVNPLILDLILLVAEKYKIEYFSRNKTD